MLSDNHLEADNHTTSASLTISERLENEKPARISRGNKEKLECAGEKGVIDESLDDD